MRNIKEIKYKSTLIYILVTSVLLLMFITTLLVSYHNYQSIEHTKRCISDVELDIKKINKIKLKQPHTIIFKSPLSMDKLDLEKAESRAIAKIKQGMTLTFGSLKTKKDFADKKGKIAKLMGSKFANFWVIPNHDTQYVKNDFTNCYFANSNDIYHMKCVAYAQYQVKEAGQSVPCSIMLLIDYDLSEQKVNNFDIVTFLTNDVLDYTGSNL